MKKKPEPRTVEYLDYHECAEFVSHKLGYDIDDVFNNRGSLNKKEEYRNYWHFLVEATGLSNGSSIHMPSEDRGLPWQQEITKAFSAEFGPDAEYRVSW